jgi:hypothetical protein
VLIAWWANRGNSTIRNLKVANYNPFREYTPLSTANFNYSLPTDYTYGTDGVLTVRSSGNTHMLSKTLYTLPLYVECTLKPITGDTTLLVTTETLNTRSNFKSDGSSSIVWGTGSHGTSKYAWAVSGTYSNGEHTDPYRSSMTKFSMFIDETEVIMYQGEGVEKYRRTRATYPSFWASVVANGGNVRVGTWEWEDGDYTDFKIGSTNPWV